MPTPVQIIKKYDEAEARRWARRSTINELMGLYRDVKKMACRALPVVLAGIIVCLGIVFLGVI